MPSQAIPFGPNRLVATRRNRSKIYTKSWKEYQQSQAHMRTVNKVNHKVSGSLLEKQFSSKNIDIGQPSANIGNDSTKGARKSNNVPASKGMKQPSVSSHALQRKGEVHDASQPTHLKAMFGLVPKTTDRLGQYSDLASHLKKRASFDKEITSAKYSTTKLESSKVGTCTSEGNDKQDEIVTDNDKENVKFGEYHKEGDTTKGKHTLDFTLSDIHYNSGSISSYPFGRGLPNFQRDNHSMDLTFKNVEKRGLLESNMGQFVNSNEKDNNSMSKKRKEPLSAENPKALDDSNVGVQVDDMSCKHMKKLKQSRVTRKDEAEGGVGDLNHMGAEDDTISILKNDHAKVSVPSCVEQQCYSCSKPIDKPTWSGIFRIDRKEYVSLDGHLSTKSCEKAWSLSKQLLKMVDMKKLSRLEVWPKAWEVSKPIAGDIAIYFFPHEMRQDEGWDQVVREVMQNDLALRAIVGEAEMLIFPSILLPNQHQTFQGKHYLWGVFKRREDKGVVVEEPLSVFVGCYEMENQQNVVSHQPNHMLLREEPNQEMIQMVSVIPLENTQEVEASRIKGPTNKGFDLNAPGEEGGQAQATPIATNAVEFLASHGQINPSVGHTPSRLMGFVVRKTPKLDRIIREIEQEGALVFAMQGEMVGAGSWTGSKATATQK